MHEPKQYLAGVAAAAFALLAATPRAEAQGTGQNSPEAIVREVAERLLAVAEPSATLHPHWPPQIAIEAVDGVDINAFAYCQATGGQRSYHVRITPGIMEHVVRRDRDVLAFILGHELGHILLEHARCDRPREQVALAQFAADRDQETAADSIGMHLAVKAGYSYRKATRGILRMIDVGLDEAPFQALASTHPSWFDRAAFTNAMQGDRQQASLWQAMGAFANGNYFLLVEQYEAAARSFKRVTAEFPNSHEAWANLGFALLMQYADALDPGDLRHFDLGHLVVPGFYRRAESLEVRVRGVNSELWWEAVGALREALRLKPDLTLALAHLGMAYLVHPSGTRDVGNATRFLNEAAALAARDTTLEPMVRAAVIVNAGVASMASGGEAEQAFAQAMSLVTASKGAGSSQIGGQIQAAVDYNRALMLQASPDGRREAFQYFERYLQSASPASAWWPIAYEHYTRLAGQLGVRPRSEAELRRGKEGAVRAIAAVEVRPDAVVTLGDPTADVQARLGTVTPVPAVSGTNLVWLRYAAHGIHVLANERVLAIILGDGASARLPVRASGLGAETTWIHVGMPEDDFNRVAGEFYEMKRLTDARTYYRYYRELGIGIRMSGGKIAEIVVAQIPDRNI